MQRGAEGGRGGLGIVDLLEHPAHGGGGQPGGGEDAATEGIGLLLVVVGVVMIAIGAVEGDGVADVALSDEVAHFVCDGGGEFIAGEGVDESAGDVDFTGGPGVSREGITIKNVKADRTGFGGKRGNQRVGDLFDTVQGMPGDSSAPLLGPCKSSRSGGMAGRDRLSRTTGKAGESDE